MYNTGNILNRKLNEVKLYDINPNYFIFTSFSIEINIVFFKDFINGV